MSFFGKKKPKFGERQRKKITADFNIFFDIKRSGKLSWEDIEQLQSHVLTVSGWSSDSVWWQNCQQFFREAWQTMLTMSATKNAQHVTAEEWVLAWTSVAKDKLDYDKKSAKAKKSSQKATKTTEKMKTTKAGSGKASKTAPPENSAKMAPTKPTDTALEKPAGAAPEKPAENGTGSGGCEVLSKDGEHLAEVETDETEPEVDVELPEYFPSWARWYFEYKFRLFDRSGDGCIDLDEYEYVLWDGFGVSPSECRDAFNVISQENEIAVDRRYFLELFIEYFLSDDVTSVGNHLNGKLVE